MSTAGRERAEGLKKRRATPTRAFAFACPIQLGFTRDHSLAAPATRSRQHFHIFLHSRLNSTTLKIFEQFTCPDGYNFRDAERLMVPLSPSNLALAVRSPDPDLKI